MNSFYALKRDQIHAYDKNGKRLFITRLLAKPLSVIMVKTLEKDKYSALQMAVGTKSRLNKPESGHLKEIVKAPLFLREVKTDQNSEYKTGEQIRVEQILEVGDIVKITARSKGKGFAGGMKRHGFHGGPRTHGQSDRERAPGAIAQGTSPGRVWKGKKMAGRMGNELVSMLGSQVVKIDTESGELWITGSVPGGKNALVKISKKRVGKFAGLIETNSNRVTSNKLTIEKDEETTEAINKPVETKIESENETKEE